MSEPTPMNPLRDLAQHLAMAELSLRLAARLAPGDAALQAGLLERAGWVSGQHRNTLDRLGHGGLRRAGDQPRRVNDGS